ncbi:monovalent cation/H+ antiporter subunit E [Halomicroarcula sp. GCM10025817]|uniref:monovalent cation/H+ antiporter subunit E n=1 Tax=Haloarcula TaxID=2237 RepID=UPI0023E7C55D|nr:monovalent cation/H+ antiporter subunit E [Halomicroarcula sp. SYNS111]
MTVPDPHRLLVPVDDSVTVRNTVAYAIDQAETLRRDGDAPVELHFVVVPGTRAVDPDAPEELGAATDLLDRVAVWTDEDFGGDPPEGLSVTLEVVGADRYLFSPGDYADVLLEYAADRDIGRAILDPEYNPGGAAPMLRPLEIELARNGLEVEEAPVEREARQTVLARAATLPKYLSVFAASYLFYLLLSPWKPLDFFTGAITATLVSALLAPIAFSKQPSITRVPVQLVRMTIYVPYLLWQIALANLHIAKVVLHPSLPIDPTVVRYRAAVWGDAPVTTLANSITLTPGTLTISVSDRAFNVHSLTDNSRDDLEAGGLERAVRFVFYGREAAAIASPGERDDCEEVTYDG